METPCGIWISSISGIFFQHTLMCESKNPRSQTTSDWPNKSRKLAGSRPLAKNTDFLYMWTAATVSAQTCDALPCSSALSSTGRRETTSCPHSRAKENGSPNCARRVTSGTGPCPRSVRVRLCVFASFCILTVFCEMCQRSSRELPSVI